MVLSLLSCFLPKKIAKKSQKTRKNNIIDISATECKEDFETFRPSKPFSRNRQTRIPIRRKSSESFKKNKKRCFSMTKTQLEKYQKKKVENERKNEIIKMHKRISQKHVAKLYMKRK